MNMDSWRTALFQVVDGISDGDMQKRAWLGLGPEVDSPTETYCMLFDDMAVVDFLAHPENGLDLRQIELGNRIVSLMNDFRPIARISSPEDILRDERWIRIQAAAKDFLDYRPRS